MLDVVSELVGCESPTNDSEALGRCAEVVSRAAFNLVAHQPERIGRPDFPVLRWDFGGTPRVLLVGHFDTVWPMGTLARWPLTVDGDRVSGPGAFDMKSGIVQLFEALATLDDLEGLVVLLNSDEETGSHASRELIETEARRVGSEGAALILEPSAAGALKTGRKGVSLYTVHVDGKAAHAGLEPEKGANATIELAHQVLEINSFGRPEVGTTVTPTVVAAGTTTNTVPAAGRLDVDVRATSDQEQRRVDADMRELKARVAGTTLRLDGGINRPPLARASSAALFARAQKVAETLGLASLAGVEVGGGSDGNFTAGVGVPTLDGLGAVGDNAHAEGEYALLSAMPDRAALLAALLDDLRTGERHLR